MTDELFLFRKHHCQHEVKWRSGFIEDKLTRHCTIGRIVHFEIKLDYGFKIPEWYIYFSYLFFGLVFDVTNHVTRSITIYVYI